MPGINENYQTQKLDEKVPHRVIQIRPGFKNNDDEIKQNKIKVHISRPYPSATSNYSSTNPPPSYLNQNPNTTTLKADPNPTKANINTEPSKITTPIHPGISVISYKKESPSNVYQPSNINPSFKNTNPVYSTTNESNPYNNRVITRTQLE